MKKQAKQTKQSKPPPQKKKTVTFQRSTSTEEKILISLFNQKNRTGIAIYDETKDQVIVSSVVEVETNDFQNLFKFLTGYTSVKYIIPQRCNKEFLDNLNLIDNFNKTHFNDETGSVRTKEESVLDNLGTELTEHSFYTVNKSDYEPQYTLDCLLNANYENVLEQENTHGQENRTGHFDKKTKIMYLKGILDMENVPMISSLGGLLSFLFQSSKLKRNFNIEKIKMKQPQKNVYIAMKTYNSLSIIKEEIHPSQIKGKGRSKEGFSILNLFDSMISTTHGRKLLRNWFLNPTYEIDILEERLYAVNFILSQLSSNDFEKIRKHLKKAYDTVLILTKFKNDTVTKEHWKKLEYSIENFLQIKIVLQALTEEEEEIRAEKDRLFPLIISKILNFQDDELLSLQQLFIMALKFKDNSDRIEINPGISEELDDLRKLYDNLDEILTFYAKKELEKLPETSDIQLSLTYMPHFGYLVSIPKGSLDETLNDLSNQSRAETDRSFLRSRSDPKDEDSIQDQQRGMGRKLTQINEMNSDEEEEGGDYDRYEYEDEDVDGEYGVDMTFQNVRNDKRKKGQGTSDKTSQDIVMGEDWEFQFETKDFFYFKSDQTSQLDDIYGDIGGQIVDIEQEILREIEKQILDCSDVLIHMSDIIAEFDCLFCFAQVAKQHNFVRPILTTESYFLIKNGRHILSEISAERQFIPNDLFVYNYIDEYDQDFDTSTDHPINKNHSNRFILLSGPNFSGKSIYLKQVGIIVFLCHIGSFVPASLCKIGLVDSIFSCIHLTETVSGDECGFSEEMQDLSKIFRLATNRSLILFDEFGKNAPFSVGLASCVALIRYLTKDHFKQNAYLTSNAIKIDREDKIYQKKDLYERIPTTILITHHKEIFQENLISEDYIIRFFTMEAIIQNGNQYYSFLKEENQNQARNPNHKYINMKEGLKVTQLEEQDKIIFMYRLKPGFSVNSFSIFCAKQIGFDKEILLRINEIQNIPREEIQPNEQVIKKYEDTIRDLLFRINDFLCYVSNNE